MSATTPRQTYDAALERLVDAIDAGDRQAAVLAFADAQAFEPTDARTELAQWLADEQRRVIDLRDDLDAEPKGWTRGR